MASSSILKLSTCAMLIIMCMVIIIGAPFGAEAEVSCNLVASSLGPCLVYLRSQGQGGVPGGCCDGIKRLNNAAKTTLDKQEACRCMTSAASRITSINFGLAASLPKNCGVNIPYKISPATDCNKVK